MKVIINITLIISIFLAVFIIHKDLEKQELVTIKQQEDIDSLIKKLGYHDTRISSQMDTLMVHLSRLEQIKKFLENMRSPFVKNLTSNHE